jgi:mRNA-degrading endonuclease RelE of RelBE toxin-antitoxin system
LNGYEVLLSSVAAKFLERLDRGTAARIRKCLGLLSENPYHSRPGADIKQLSGSSNPVFYRLRVGDYRTIYVVDGRKVKVTEIMARGRGYAWLE